MNGTVALLSALWLSAGALAQDMMSVSNGATLGFSPHRLMQIDAWYQAQIDAGALPGAVVAIARNGELAHLRALGYQDRARKTPMLPDAIFWIASMTKPVTSVAAMMLVEQGKLDLDAPVDQYLPGLKDMKVAVEKTDPATGQTELMLEPQERPMSVLDLLRHTAGLIYGGKEYGNTSVHLLYNQLYGPGGVWNRDRTLAEFV
jgi:CubicO group peptidase (beta-lactamase class C family)